MGLLSWLRTKDPAPTAITGDERAVTVAATKTAPKRGTDELLASYSTSPWLRAASGKIARAVAAVEWRVFRPTGGGRSRISRQLKNVSDENREGVKKQLLDQGVIEEVMDHPVIDLLDSGNDFMDGHQLRQITQVQLDLVGEGFWLKERDGLGNITELWNIPPNWIREVPVPGGNDFFKVQPTGSNAYTNVPRTEMCWFVDHDPKDPYRRGSGAGCSLGDEIDTDELASKHTKSWFYNGARPDLLVMADGLQRSDTVRLEQTWLAQHTGPHRRFRPHFIGKKLDVKEISQSFADMELVELRKHERDVIVQTFGIPPEILGILTNSNRATSENAEFLFARFALVPRLELMKRVIQARIVNEIDRSLILDFDSPATEDKAHRLQVMKTASWAFTVDEWRDEAGRDPLADERGQTFVISTRLASIDDLRELPNPNEAAATEQDEEPDDDEDDDEAAEDEERIVSLPERRTQTNE